MITFMDEYNEITKSPTLVSFGGSNVTDHTIYYLDLEPKLTNDSSTQCYEWKELLTLTNNVNGEYFKNNKLDYSSASMVYSRKLQQLIIFEGWSHGIYCLCLKTKTWAKALELNFVGWPVYYRHFLKLCDEQTNNALLLSRLSTDYEINLSVGVIDLKELCDTIKNPNKSVTFGQPPKSCARKGVTPHSVVPLWHEKKLLIFDSFKEIVTTISLSSNCGDEKRHPCDIMERGCRRLVACALPKDGYSVTTNKEELHGSHALISFIDDDKKHSLFEYDSKSEVFTRLVHNSLPIQLEHHAFFQTVLFAYRNRRQERCAVLIPNLDVLFKIKLDYEKPECTLPYLRKQLLTLLEENSENGTNSCMGKDIVAVICHNHFIH